MSLLIRYYYTPIHLFVQNRLQIVVHFSALFNLFNLHFKKWRQDSLFVNGLQLAHVDINARTLWMHIYIFSYLFWDPIIKLPIATFLSLDQSGLFKGWKGLLNWSFVSKHKTIKTPICSFVIWMPATQWTKCAVLNAERGGHSCFQNSTNKATRRRRKSSPEHTITSCFIIYMYIQ